MELKGQYLSLEQMILFTISIVIMVMIYYSFSLLTEDVGESIAKDQMEEVSEVVIAGLYTTFNSYENGVEYRRIEIDIPKEISGEMYKVNIMDRNKIRVYGDGGPEIQQAMGGISDEIHIKMDEGFMTGVTSRKGKIFIELDSNVIKVGR